MNLKDARVSRWRKNGKRRVGKRCRERERERERERKRKRKRSVRASGERERKRKKEKTEVIGTQLDLEWYLESRLGRGPG